MPKFVKDESQRKVACNVSLPLEFLGVIDDYVRSLKATFGDQLPRTFGRSDLIRLMVDRYLCTPYRLRSGKRIDLTNGDEMTLTLDVAKEYGLVELPQLPLSFDTEIENSINSKESK